MARNFAERAKPCDIPMNSVAACVRWRDVSRSIGTMDRRHPRLPSCGITAPFRTGGNPYVNRGHCPVGAGIPVRERTRAWGDGTRRVLGHTDSTLDVRHHLSTSARDCCVDRLVSAIVVPSDYECDAWSQRSRDPLMVPFAPGWRPGGAGVRQWRVPGRHWRRARYRGLPGRRNQR